MGWRDWIGLGTSRTKLPEQTELSTGPPPPPAPDLKPFERDEFGFGRVRGFGLGLAPSIHHGDLTAETPPDLVPFEMLLAMRWDPVVNFAERAVAAPVEDADLFAIQHEDPAIKAETEAWLRPLLPKLLPVIVRAVAYGCVPYVLDYANPVTDLVLKDGTVRPDFVRFDKVHDIRADHVEVCETVGGDEVEALRHAGQVFGPDRGHVVVWRREVGEWIGQGSRRRAWRAFFRGGWFEFWHARYVERSIDPIRKGHAPKGTIKLDDGRTIPATKLLTSALMGAKGGDAISLPGEIDPVGGRLRLWDITTMDLPDRESTWHQALGREDALKLLASFVPPTVTGIEDAALSGLKEVAQLFIQYVQAVASFVAQELNEVIAPVHELEHEGDGTPPATVKAKALPAAARKLLLEVFKIAANVVRETEKGDTWTLAGAVSPEIMDALGIPRLAAEDASGDVPPADPGRPRDATSDREERRERGRSDEGEDATGGDDEGDE